MKSILLFFIALLSLAGVAAQIPMQVSMPAPQAVMPKQQMGQQQQRQSQQQQLAEFRRERQLSNPTPISYEFPEYQAPLVQYFKQSFAELQNMLDGKQDLSLKRAVFLSENAFLGNSLNYELFCSDIAAELDILKEFIRKENLDVNSDMAKKYMLQKFFSDTLTMRDSKGNYQLTHYPYKYDFDDPFGTKDWRKMFVTKLLRDKKGQCHSMPLLYLIFAEALGVKAWLSFSPQHSYIKTQDDKGNWYNFETTNGHYSTDSWLLSSGYVKTEAMRNKIFMDTLSQKETVAACLFDLANTYVRQFGFDKFILQCADKIMEHSPKNVFALQLKSDYYTYLFQYVAQQLGFPPKEQIPQYPQAYALMQKMYEQYRLVEQTGYENMPEDMYQAWLQSFEKERGKQPTKIIKP